MIIQLVRECPPGYGGVERVAHELAMEWRRRRVKVQTFCFQPAPATRVDPGQTVAYELSSLPRVSLGQLLCPLPSRRLWSLLNRRDPLYVHLPCPALLSLTMLARLRHPRRLIRIHWHAFLQPDASPLGLLMAMYQWIALRWAAIGVQTVVTTSPVLADVLEQEGVPPSRIRILPCCLGEEQESRARCLAEARRPEASAAPAATRSLRLLFIGRLDSYKRVDLLIEAFAQSRAGRLDLVGEGPRREDFQRLASSSGRGEQITFHGRLDEVRKQNLLQHADLLVLPADRSNEAFGIVQLEAMACGVPSLALDCPRSGVAWVGQLKPLLGFPRLGHRELAAAINRLIEEPDLLRQASESALRRYGEIFARSVWQARFSAMLS